MEFASDSEVAERYSWGMQRNVDASNVANLVLGGRSRWKIENETFNTLKNQGYNLDHNYGLGRKNLSTVFVLTVIIFDVASNPSRSRPGGICI
jgi:hypothetical protein